MPDQTGITKSPKQVGLDAAREELQVLDCLSTGVSAQIADLSGRPQWHGKVDDTEVALQEHRYRRLKAYQELAHTCYGRTVKGTEVDENDRLRGSFTFRITQANVGYLEKGCFVIPRNSALASELVTAQPGDQRDFTTPTRDRFFDVSEVRTFDGPISLRSPNQEPNFRLMSLRTIGSQKPIVLEDLRRAVHALLAPDQHDEQPREAAPSGVDPTWLTHWSGIYLGDSEEISLGHQFFTRTTTDQERALNNPRGLTFVEGIAGAGKTSVALGRLKYFANFSTGEETERHGLENVLPADFSPVGMVGFVLNPSLKRYLKETADALDLARLPIKDLEEFRTDLSGRYGIADRFRRTRAEVAAIRSRIGWLRGVDAAMARAAGARLRAILNKEPSTPNSVVSAVLKIADELASAEPHPNAKLFNLSGLANRIAQTVADAELRERESAEYARSRVRETTDPERRRIEERSLEFEMRRIQQDAEKKILSPLSRSLIAALTSPDLISPAIMLDEFSTLVQKAFGLQPQETVKHEINDAANQLRFALQQTAERRTLADADIVTLIVLAAMIADGLEFNDPTGALGHLYQMRRCTAVFIDEVQDFSEIEIVLMGMAATSAYHQITLSGDRCQRLQSTGAELYDDLFPLVPRAQHNASIFLDINHRQREELAAFSEGFRSLIQGDAKTSFSADKTTNPVTIYKYTARERMADFILERIRSVPRHATIAVIMPSIDGAKAWFDLLEEELTGYHRPALMSRRDDLTRRFTIHFTEVRETKGLEFDVVIVPDLGAFDLGSTIGCNQAYVAISRPKHAVVLGCDDRCVAKPAIESLTRNGLVHIKDIPSH
jgi:superfamily I DNA/RNA helicase